MVVDNDNHDFTEAAFQVQLKLACLSSAVLIVGAPDVLKEKCACVREQLVMIQAKTNKRNGIEMGYAQCAAPNVI